MTLKTWQQAVLLLIFSAALLALGYGPDRTNAPWLFTFTGLAFMAYLFIANSTLSWKTTLGIAVLLRLSLLFAPVGWTDDHFRYVFDGGVSFFNTTNVYNTTPELAKHEHHLLGEEFVPLVNHSGTYTVYPPFAQVVFELAFRMGSGGLLQEEGKTNIKGVILCMRGVIILLELLSMLAILGLLSALALPRYWLAWYALNPLVIMEFAVNLHTEVYMVTWCLLAALALIKGRWLFSAVFLGLGAAAKLWPLMFLALLPAWLGWVRAIKYGMVMVAVFIILWVPYYSESLISNISESLNLYFSYFEFNASIYYILKFLLPEGWVKGSALLSGTTVLLITLTGLVAWKQKWKSALEGMMWALAIYFALASTVHPWYILPLLAFACITHYRWPFIWSALIIPTYLTYAQLPYQQPFGWLWVEYVLLFGVIALELMVHSSWAMKRRAAIKFNHLKDMVQKGDMVLDIGTGNGSLANRLMQHGAAVTTVDIVHKSRFERVIPQIFDGKTLPFENNSFDKVLLITVLHHTQVHNELISEAKRVGKEVIIMEDVYNTSIQRYMTYLFDSLINLEFWGHPHSNRSEMQWQNLLVTEGWELSQKVNLKTLGYFNQVIFHSRRAGA